MGEGNRGSHKKHLQSLRNLNYPITAPEGVLSGNRSSLHISHPRFNDGQLKKLTPVFYLDLVKANTSPKTVVAKVFMVVLDAHSLLRKRGAFNAGYELGTEF